MVTAKRYDVVVASHDGVEVWFGDGRGQLKASEQGFLTLPSTTGAALGDLDGDGDLDLFVTRYEKQPSQVLLSDGNGRLRNSGQKLGVGEHWRVTLGDLDQDGDLDAFLVGTFNSFTSPGISHPHELWLNDGKGVFANSGQRFTGIGGFDAAFNDLDRDGDLDVAVVERNGVAIWINEGRAKFRETETRFSGRSEPDVRAFAVGDLDGDKDADIILARPSQCEVWLNRGKGEFAPAGIFATNAQTIAVALGDLDGNGNLDVFLGANARSPNRVLLNDGKGAFADTGQTLAGGHTLDIALVDFDRDGDLDAIQANRNAANRLWINNGKGIFEDSNRHFGNELGQLKSRRIAIGSLR